jgi:hypothetical protein
MLFVCSSHPLNSITASHNCERYVKSNMQMVTRDSRLYQFKMAMNKMKQPSRTNTFGHSTASQWGVNVSDCIRRDFVSSSVRLHAVGRSVPLPVTARSNVAHYVCSHEFLRFDHQFALSQVSPGKKTAMFAFHVTGEVMRVLFYFFGSPGRSGQDHGVR